MKKKKLIFQYNAPFSLTFALIALIALILGILTNGATTTKFFCVYRSALTDPLTYLRFFTHALGHSGMSHYTGNIILILVLGPGLEERYGTRSVLFAALITAFVSGLVQWIFFPTVALLGASGIVFMMIIMASLGGSRGEGIPLTLIFVFLFYVGQEIYEGLFVSDNISQITHIIGGICGAVLGMSLRRR